MSLSVEQLMQRRYKVIADYPNSPYKIGDILVEQNLGATENPFYLQGRFGFANESSLYYPQKYRANLEPLPWWSERKAEEMPPYLKLVLNNKILIVRKVEKWEGFNTYNQPLYSYYNKVNYLSVACIYGLDPATESEYLTYKQNNP